MKMSMPIRKDGPSWYVDFSYRGRRYKRRSPINSQAGAREFELRLRQRIMLGESLDDAPKITTVTTFQEFSKRWMDNYVRANNKPSEMENKAGVLRNHLVPFFGNTSIKDIKRERVEEYKVMKLNAGLSAKTINNHLAFLAKCLNCAIDWEVIDAKDMPRIKKLKSSMKQIDFLSPSDTAQLLADRSEPMYNLMIYVALRTGLRFGELLGLKWEAINFEANVLTVQESIVRGQVGTPKSGKIRHVPLSQDLRQELLKHRKSSGRLFEVKGFENISARMATNALHRILKRVKLTRHVNWHMFRHTFASHLTMNGTPIPVIQKFMGHASIEMTMRYAHLSPNAHADSVNCFQQMETAALHESRPPAVHEQVAVPNN